MKHWVKVLFTGIICVMLFLSGIHLFIVLRGKAIIVRDLEGLTKRKVSIGDFSVSPPFNLKVRNLDIEGLLKADSVLIAPSIPAFATGTIALNKIEIIKPELTYEKVISSFLDLPVIPPLAGVESEPPNSSNTLFGRFNIPVLDKPSQKSPPFFIIKSMSIKGGKINFIDHTAGPEGIKITVKDIYFNLANLYIFPRLAVANFDFTGDIPWQEGIEEGQIDFRGWINPYKRDMQANLKITDIDGIYLYPYYRQWVDLEKVRIEKAKLNFSSNITGLNNDVAAACHLELTNIVFKPHEPKEGAEKEEKLASAVLDIFRALNEGKINLDFTVNTKMDKPEFGFASIKMAFEEKLAKGMRGDGKFISNVFMFPGRFLGDMLKSTVNISRAVVSGAVAISKEVKKTAEDTVLK